MNDICSCGQFAIAQGYCEKCLAEFEIHLSNDVKMEQFEVYANKPRTKEELETEALITESLQEPDTTKTQSIIQPTGGTMSSKLTDVTVYPYNKEGNLKAFVTITLNGDYVTKSIRLMDGKNGLFLGFPQNQKGNVNHDISFPATATLRDKITKAAIAKYNGDEVTFESLIEKAPEEEPAKA